MVLIFPIIVLLLCGVTVFTAHSLYSGLVCVAPRVKRWHAVLAVALLNATMLIGFVRSLLPLPDFLKALFGTVGSYWMGFVLYLLLFLLAAWAVLLVLRFTPLKACDKRRFFAMLAAVVSAVVTTAYGCIHACDTVTVSYTVALDDGKEAPDMSIVMISDLHLGALGSEARLDGLVDEINRLEADVVCIAGDIFDSDFNAIRDPDRVAEQLGAIRATYGVYACLGNHDAGATFPKMTAFLERCHIMLLAEQATVIDERLVLIGRLDRSPIGDNGGQKRQELSAFWTAEDPSLPVVVMDHNPAHIDEYTADVDLVLSGHTHKGQLFPAGFVTDAMYAIDHGHGRLHAQSPQIIVSSGVGTWGMPMRVGTDSELVHITFS